jgi:hypothetical protein
VKVLTSLTINPSNFYTSSCDPLKPLKCLWYNYLAPSFSLCSQIGGLMRTDKHLPHSSAITPPNGFWVFMATFKFTTARRRLATTGKTQSSSSSVDLYHHICTLWVWFCTKKLSISTIDKNCGPNALLL